MKWVFFCAWMAAGLAMTCDVAFAVIEPARFNIWKTGFDVILLIAWTSALLAETEPDE